MARQKREEHRPGAKRFSASALSRSDGNARFQFGRLNIATTPLKARNQGAPGALGSLLRRPIALVITICLRESYSVLKV